MIVKQSAARDTAHHTTDPRVPTNPLSSFHQSSTLKLLATLKANARNTKAHVASTGHCHNFNSTSKGRPNASGEGKEEGRAAHLATFSSPEQLATLKAQEAKRIHEEALKSELTKFRHEVEQKFRSSTTNRLYSFPRLVLPDSTEAETDTAITDSPDCRTCSIDAA